MSEKIRKDKWYAFVQGWIVGFATLGFIAVEMTVWLLVAYFSIALALLLFGYLVIGDGGEDR